MITIMICGSRTITNKDWVFKHAEDYLREIYEITKDCDFKIIQGGARGIDQLAADFATSRNYQCLTYPAEWDKYGKAAGPIRNEKMVKDCDYCLIFWDGSSRGTKNDIDLCERYNKPHKIILKENS